MFMVMRCIPVVTDPVWPGRSRLGWPGTGLWRLPAGLERLGRTREGHV